MQIYILRICIVFLHTSNSLTKWIMVEVTDILQFSAASKKYIIPVR